MIAIVDYGMGNLRSVQAGLEYVGQKVFVTDDPKKVIDAPAVVLPGVGAFGDAIERLEKTGLGDAFREAVQSGKPCLGICLGLQLLFSESDEGGLYRGLDIIPGKVKRFSNQLKVPHMGWNSVYESNSSYLTKDLPEDLRFYFVHSYYVKVGNEKNSILKTDYGIVFDSAIQRDNIFGVQFHPEKSHKFGMKLLENFAKL